MEQIRLGHKGVEQKSSGTSAFLITLAPNYSHKRFAENDADGRQEFAELVLEMAHEFSKLLCSGELMKGFKSKKQKGTPDEPITPPECVENEWHPEIGKKDGRIHAHGYVRFNGKCHVHLTKSRAWLKQYWCPRLNVKTIRIEAKATDPDADAVKEYIRKDQSLGEDGIANTADDTEQPEEPQIIRINELDHDQIEFDPPIVGRIKL